MFACMYLNVCVCSHLNAHMSVGKAWAWSCLTFGHKVSWVITWVCHSLSVTCSSCRGQLEVPHLRSFFLPPHMEGMSLNGSRWSKSGCYISRCQEGWKQTSFHSAFVGGIWWDVTFEPVDVWWNNSRQHMETLISLRDQWESERAAPTWDESLTSPPRTSGRSSLCG